MAATHSDEFKRDAVRIALTGGLARHLFDGGTGATNLFMQNIRAAEWVEISFGLQSHRFSLAGSTKTLDAIRPCLR